jgi:hypothetical protein
LGIRDTWGCGAAPRVRWCRLVGVLAEDATGPGRRTTPGCPIGPQVTEQIEEFVGELDGVKAVESEMVFTPPWSPEKMSEDAKFALGF